MSCCGQKRRQWQQERLPQQTMQNIPEPVLQNPVLLQYNGSHSQMAKGENSGLLYLFASGETLAVDSRDVTPLLRNENFILV